MRHAEEINAFQALGVGSIAYLRVLDFFDVKSLAGADADIAPHETAVALFDADGSPHLIRGNVADVLIAAEERGFPIN